MFQIIIASFRAVAVIAADLPFRMEIRIKKLCRLAFFRFPMAFAVFRNAIFNRELTFGMWCESTFPLLILLFGASMSQAVNCFADGNFRIPSSPISLIIAIINPSFTPSIAISNHRIQNIDDESVVFQYKDYKDGAKKKTMRLTHAEFLRRFALHILPKRFVKIRQYGFMASRVKRKLKIHQMKQGKLSGKQEKISYTEICKAQLGYDLEQCPCCKTGKMIIVLQFGANAPPIVINDKRKTMKIK